MSIFSWYRRLARNFKAKSQPTYRVAFVEELPEKMSDKTFYFIGSRPWAAALVCPCGCTALIQLSLLSDDSPSWRVRLDSNRMPSVYPSIWRTQGCEAHFFLRHGRIYWVLADFRTVAMNGTNFRKREKQD